jgi:phosphohistidine phosphatase
MKHLLLLRHAKAEPGTGGMRDRDRPLAPRGHRDAELIGRALAAEPPPDLILCSPALRTRETLAGLLRPFVARPPVDLEEALYSGERDYIATIAAHGGDAGRLLVIGHNPTIHLTALALAADGDAALRLRLAEKFPTAALAVLALPIAAWRELAAGQGTLESLLFPRDLGGPEDDA